MGHDADEIARRQLAAVKARIARLEALKGELERMLSSCAQDQMARCNVIEILGDHALCAHDHLTEDEFIPS